jgi:acetate---CoA ligase (ADP-forming)
VPVFRSLSDGMHAARSVLARAAFRESLGQQEGTTVTVDVSAADRLHGSQTEAALYPALKAAGLPVLPFRIVGDVDSALGAAADIGYPVVLKGVARTVAHKTEAGLVRLAISDPDELRNAWASLAQRMNEMVAAGVVFDGVLVQQHARRGLEVIVGVNHEPGWGSVVVVGLGGVLAEALADTAVEPVPVSGNEAALLPGRLRGARLFEEFRDSPARDTKALTALVQQVSAFAEGLGDRLVELDLNPVIVYENGGGAAIADAFAVFADVEGSVTTKERMR